MHICSLYISNVNTFSFSTKCELSLGRRGSFADGQCCLSIIFQRSSGNFTPLKELVTEYNKLISRKRGASLSLPKAPASKRQLRQGELGDSSDSSSSDEGPVKIAAVSNFIHYHSDKIISSNPSSVSVVVWRSTPKIGFLYSRTTKLFFLSKIYFK